MLQWRPGSASEDPLERPRGRPLRLPHPGREDPQAADAAHARSTRQPRRETGRVRRLPANCKTSGRATGMRALPTRIATSAAPADSGVWRMDLDSGRCATASSPSPRLAKIPPGGRKLGRQALPQPPPVESRRQAVPVVPSLDRATASRRASSPPPRTAATCVCSRPAARRTRCGAIPSTC